MVVVNWCCLDVKNLKPPTSRVHASNHIPANFQPTQWAGPQAVAHHPQRVRTGEDKNPHLKPNISSHRLIWLLRETKLNNNDAGRIPACFRGAIAARAPPSSAATGPHLTTFVYDTRHGAALLAWSRTVLGLSLRVDLHLASAADEPLRFRVRPWLFWKRRGAKRISFPDRGAAVDVAWDLTRARFAGGPEPSAGFFVAVAIDDEMLLVAGDLVDDAYKKTKVIRSMDSAVIPISRREHVVLGGKEYRTRVRVGGKEREISIEIGGGGGGGGKEMGMSVGVDGSRVLHVRRIRWMFRGTERVEVDGGGGAVQLSWNLHSWLVDKNQVDPAGPPPAATVAPELESAATFVFRFEREEKSGDEGDFGKALLYNRGIGGDLGKSRDWSESSSGGGGGGRGERRRKKSLMKTRSSSSSSSSVSSAASSIVMDWASPEEDELRSAADGFSLVVYAWKR